MLKGADAGSLADAHEIGLNSQGQATLGGFRKLMQRRVLGDAQVLFPTSRGPVKIACNRAHAGVQKQLFARALGVKTMDQNAHVKGL